MVHVLVAIDSAKIIKQIAAEGGRKNLLDHRRDGSDL